MVVEDQTNFVILLWDPRAPMRKHHGMGLFFSWPLSGKSRFPATGHCRLHRPIPTPLGENVLVTLDHGNNRGGRVSNPQDGPVPSSEDYLQ